MVSYGSCQREETADPGCGWTESSGYASAVEGIFGRECSLTPHIGEMSRLCGRSIGEIQETIAQTAVDYAKETGTVCVQKDACTVVTDGKDDIYLNLSGNSGMATAGSGDVLAGLLAGILCMYLKTEEQPSMVLKAALGVYLHGLCGDLAAAERKTQYAGGRYHRISAPGFSDM